jgi:hypothetical protein
VPAQHYRRLSWLLSPTRLRFLLLQQKGPPSRGAAAPAAIEPARLGKEQPSGTHVTSLAHPGPCRAPRQSPGGAVTSPRGARPGPGQPGSPPNDQFSRQTHRAWSRWCLPVTPPREYSRRCPLVPLPFLSAKPLQVCRINTKPRVLRSALTFAPGPNNFISAIGRSRNP